jgi:hypothetical protein
MLEMKKSIACMLFFTLGGCASTPSVNHVALTPTPGATATLTAYEPGLIEFQWKRHCKILIDQVDGLPVGDATGPIRVSPGEHVVGFTLRCRDYRYNHVSRSLTFVDGRDYLLSSTFDVEAVQFVYRFLDMTASPPAVMGEYTANSKSETPPFILLLPVMIKR